MFPSSMTSIFQKVLQALWQMHHVHMRQPSLGGKNGMNFIFRFYVYILGKNQKAEAQKPTLCRTHVS